MKKIICIALVIVSALTCVLLTVGCSPNEDKSEVKVVKEKDLVDLVKWVGRTEYRNGEMFCYYTATGFSVRFMGSELKAVFNASNTDSDKNRPYFAAEVNGERTTFCLTEAKQTVTLASRLKSGTVHTVTVYKLSEPENSLTSVSEISTDGKFVKAPQHSGYKFQILGGSGISGHGCLGKPSEGWTTENSSSLQGFGFLASEQFGAECQFVSNSGMGLKWSYRGVEPLESAYEAIGLVASYYDSGATKSVTAQGEWDHTQWIPDAVIVNIGGNDFNSHIKQLSGSKRTAAEKEFKEAVARFLERIRSLYPNAYVLWTVSSVRTGNGSLAKEAIETLTFKENVKLVEISDETGGADNHADVTTQIKNAAAVANVLQSLGFKKQV